MLSLVALPPQASVAQDAKLAGFWKLRSFQIEDVATKEVRNLYGEGPVGHMALTEDGRFYADAFNTPAGPRPTLYDDIGCSLADCDQWRYGTVYSGSYRLDGARFIMRVERARTEGVVGVQPFDLTWTEGKSPNEQMRNFRMDAGETVTLHLETSPMINPNGSGNTIIGRVVWERQ
jgi:hypothetical protein